MNRNTLGASERLKQKKLIQEVFADGAMSVHTPHLRVKFLTKSTLQFPLQAGFSVSKRNYKKAVDRNQIKRWMRESYRTQNENLLDLLREMDSRMIIFVMYTQNEVKPNFEIIRTEMGTVLRSIIKKLRKQQHALDQ